MFRNRTLQPQIEAQITNAILRRFQTDGTLRVESQPRADVVIEGEIVRYQRTLARSLREETGVPREYRISIAAEIVVKNAITGDIVLKKTTVTGQADTFIGEDQQSAELQALPLVAEDLARQVVSLLVEKW